MKRLPKKGVYGTLTKDNAAASKRYRALRYIECNPWCTLDEIIRKFRLSVIDIRTAGNGLVKVRVYADKPHNIVCDNMWMTRADADYALAASAI